MQSVSQSFFSIQKGLEANYFRNEVLYPYLIISQEDAYGSFPYFKKYLRKRLSKVYI
jgi:hypothetical protein